MSPAALGWLLGALPTAARVSQHLGDASLHDEEVRVVDIELY
jgi:hypothetical protein